MILSLLIVVPFHPVHATAPVGKLFDNIIVVAMENRRYESVFGIGNGNVNATFLKSMLPYSTTFTGYKWNGADGRSVDGNCSAACYVDFTAGDGYSVQDSSECNNGCLTVTNIVNRFTTAGLTWQMYCESGCPRQSNHFPWLAYSNTYGSSNVFTGSTVSTSDLIAAANSANPPNYLWYTPTDCNNMHDDSTGCGTLNPVQHGDQYLETFLVGSGTVTSPTPGSLLASNLFKPGHRTLLFIWWDECNGDFTSCDSDNATPNLLYGVDNQGRVSLNIHYDHYSALRMIEDNWSLSTMTSNDAAAIGMLTETNPPNTPFQYITSSDPNFQTNTASVCSESSSNEQYWHPNVHGTTRGGSSEKSCAVVKNGALITNEYSQDTDQWSNPDDATGDQGNFPWQGTSEGTGCLDQEYAPDYACARTTVGPYFRATTESALALNATFKLLNVSIPNGDYHIIVDLYFLLPGNYTENAPSGSGITTCPCKYDWVEAMIILGSRENGNYPAIGSTTEFDAGDAFGYSKVVQQDATVGDTFSLTNYDVVQFFNGALDAWGINPHPVGKLFGVSIGTEGISAGSLAYIATQWLNLQIKVQPTFTVNGPWGCTLPNIGSTCKVIFNLGSINGFGDTLSFSTLSMPSQVSVAWAPTTVIVEYSAYGPVGKTNMTLTQNGSCVVANPQAVATGTIGESQTSLGHVSCPAASSISAVAGPTCGENMGLGTSISTGSYSSGSGDVTVVVAGTMHGPVTFTSSMVTDTIGNTYSLRTSNNDVGVWTAIARSSGSNNITFTGGSSTYWAICAEEYSGASVGAKVNTSSGTGTSLPVTVSGAASTSWVVGGFVSWRTASISMSNPDVQRQNKVNPNLDIDEGDVPAGASTTLTATLSASTSWYGAAIELT